MITHIDQCTQCQLELDTLQASANDWINNAAESSPTTYSSSSLTTRLDKIKLDRAGLVGNVEAGSPVSRFQDMTPWFDPIEDADQTSSHGPIIGRIAEFDLLKLIGRGGMGAVFKAFDRKLERMVALKMMSPSLLADPNSSKRFLREARSAAGINHPNAVAVHCVDEIRGLPYLVMEYVAGESLDELLRRTPKLPLDASLTIVEQLAEGLAAAHKTGVIHRDVKPANVLIESGTKTIKLTDFGLARTASNSLTSTGLLMGTPEFLAPEQLTTTDVDHRVDLFSLGSVLYLLCAGQVPFDGPSAHAIMNQISREDPTPIEQLEPKTPRALAELIGQLLQKNPEHRPESASQVARSIRAFKASSANRVDTQPALSNPSRNTGAAKTETGFQPWWATAAAIPVLTCLGWLVWSWSIKPNLNPAAPRNVARIAGQSESSRQVSDSGQTIKLKDSEEWVEFFEELESSDLPNELNIQLDSNEVFLVEPIEFEDRNISVIAATGRKPTIVFELEDEIRSCIFVEGGTLHLDGITIKTDADDVDEEEEEEFDEEEDESVLAIIRCYDGTISMNNCRLVTQHLDCLHLEDSECRLTGCDFLSGERAGIHFSTFDAGGLLIENCLLAGDENLSVGLGAACSIDLNNNTFVGVHSIVIYRSDEPEQVEISARKNVFDAAECILLFGDYGSEIADEIKKDLKWIGDSNLLPKSAVQCLSDLDENLVPDSDQISGINIVDSSSVAAAPKYRLDREEVQNRSLKGTLRVADVELSGEHSKKYGVRTVQK